MYKIELHYICEMEQAWAMMYAALRATVKVRNLPLMLPVASHLPTQKDLAASPAMQTLLRLVEDTSGWPMALIQLGARVGVLCLEQTPYHRRLEPDALANVELLVEACLAELYRLQTFNEVFNTSVKKIVGLAISPHPVSARLTRILIHLKPFLSYAVFISPPRRSASMNASMTRARYFRTCVVGVS